MSSITDIFGHIFLCIFILWNWEGTHIFYALLKKYYKFIFYAEKIDVIQLTSNNYLFVLNSSLLHKLKNSAQKWAELCMLIAQEFIELCMLEQVNRVDYLRCNITSKYDNYVKSKLTKFKNLYRNCRHLRTNLKGKHS